MGHTQDWPHTDALHRIGAVDAKINTLESEAPSFRMQTKRASQFDL
jgi:hypothetical protein